VGTDCGSCGSVGDIGAGGRALAGAVNGAPFCMPLSKLCRSSPGVRAWGGLAAGTDGPGRGAPAAVGSPEVGLPPNDPAGDKAAPGNDVAAVGIGPATGAGVGGGTCGGVKPAGVSPPGEVDAAGAAWFPAEGDGVKPAGESPPGEVEVEATGTARFPAEAGEMKPGVRAVGAPETPAPWSPAGGGGDADGGAKLGVAPVGDGCLSTRPFTCSDRFFWSSGCLNICPTSTPWACANWRADCPVPSSSRIRCIASSTLPLHFADARAASARDWPITATICGTFASTDCFESWISLICLLPSSAKVVRSC
jgi:hypothetical protein